MPKLSDAQIAGYAKGAGFRGNEVAIATAIAIAESSGNTHAHNDTFVTGDNSYGLWQINMIGGLGPARRAHFKLNKNEELFDPATNARVAYALYKARGNWFDWSAYTNGKYLLHLVRGHAAAKVADPNMDTLLPDSIDEKVGGAITTVQTAEKIVAFLTDKANWLRVAMFAGGSILVWVAMLAYVKDTQAAQTAIQIGKAVIPVARGAKGAA